MNKAAKTPKLFIAAVVTKMFVHFSYRSLVIVITVAIFMTSRVWLFIPCNMSLLLRLLVAAPIIFIVCGQISPPYSVKFKNRADGSNDLTLRCNDQFGAGVPRAIFYRNSQQITNSSCLTAYPTGSSSELRITLVSQECDGYFSCGVNGSLSDPVALYGKPN